MMVELIGLHGADEAKLVGAGADVRQQIGHLHAAPAITHERARAGAELGATIDEGKTDMFEHRVGQALPVVFPQAWLRIEEVELRWGAVLEDENATLRARCEMRRPRKKRVCDRQIGKGACRRI